MNTDIPVEINSILADSNAYEMIEAKVYNKLLTDTKTIQNLKQAIAEIIMKNDTISIDALVKELDINDVDSLLKFDGNTDTKQQIKDLVVKELERILY